MKHHTAFPLLAALALLLLAAGCSSNLANLREKIRPTYQAVNFEGEQPAAFDAALVALGKMGFRVTSSGAAQGKIEATTPVMPASPQSPARQTTASVRFAVAPNNCTAIQILFTDIVDNSPGGGRDGFATKQPLVSSPLYTIFASHVAAASKK